MNPETSSTTPAGAAPAATPAPAQPAAAPSATAAATTPAAPEITTAQLKAQLDALLAATNKPAAETAAPAADKTYTQQEVTQLLAQAATKPETAAKMDGPQEEIKRLQEQLATLTTKDLQNEAKKALTEASVPEGMLALVDCTDKAAMEKSVEAITTAFKASLEEGMKGILAGKTPEGLGSNTTGQQMVAAQIAKNIRGE